MIKKNIVSVMVLFMMFFLVACGDEGQEESETNQNGNSLEISEEEKVAEDEVVAIVNGNDVTGNTYNLVYAQLKMQAAQMSEEVNTDEVKEATIDSLIDREILMQQAKEEGIEVTDETVQSEIDTLKEENEEGLTTVLEQFAMTEED